MGERAHDRLVQCSADGWPDLDGDGPVEKEAAYGSDGPGPGFDLESELPRDHF